MSLAFSAEAEQIAYSQALLKSILPPGQEVDTSYLSRGLDISPGTYDMSLEVNGKTYQTRKITLREYKGRLEPVFTFADLKDLPFKEEALTKLAHVKPETELFPLSEYYDKVTAEVDAGSQILKLSIPQLFLLDDDWVDIAPEHLWDHGEPGAIVNYNLTGSHFRSSEGDSMKSSSLYGTAQAQVNLGAWRLYSSGSFNANRDEYAGFETSTHSWDRWNTYFQRDVNAVKGKLQIGEINTSGEIFDSVPMRGFRISTNEEMLSERDRTYSPVIEGVANSNAQIIIRQNERIVYTTNVAPGPFRLDALPSFGSEGDLEVVIREADGTERVMLVPYSSIPMMLKEGQYRYDLSVGQYYSPNLSPGVDRKFFTMGSLSYGLPNAVTVYGGVQVADKYLSGAIGAGLSLGRYGAVSMDATQSKAFRDPSNGINKDLSGTAWRIRYEKTMLETGTTVNLANYHYLTGNYHTLSDIAEYGARHLGEFDQNELKSQWQLALSQTLGSFGSLSASMSYETYKGDAQNTKSINLGYGTSVKGVGVYLNYSRNYEERAKEGWQSSHMVMLNLNIPLSLFFSGSGYTALNQTSVQYQGSMFRSVNGEKTYQQTAILNGSSADHKWAWTASQTMGSEETRESSIGVGYSGDSFDGNANYTYSQYGQSYMASLNGGFVLHSGGVTAMRFSNSSVALIEVPDVKGVKLSNTFDSETDRFGFAALSYLKNYSRNDIEIDPSTLPEGALLLENSNRVVYPTAGAIVKVKYPVRFGYQALLYLKLNGDPIPFGTQVALLDEEGKVDRHVQGLAGESGRVFLTALPESGRLKCTVNGKEVFFTYQLKQEQATEKKDFQAIQTLVLNAEDAQVAKPTQMNKETHEKKVPLRAERLRNLGNGRSFFLLKDADGKPLPAGTRVRYVDDLQVSDGRVSEGGFLFMSHIPETGVLFVGDLKYVY